MTNAEGDIIRYWQRKCSLCAKKNHEIHDHCKENTYHCRVENIRVY